MLGRMTLLAQLHRPVRYPRSSRYDAEWLLGLDMGPHPLWQLEDLLEGVALPAGATVLDLGAGHGATSVYLVRELDVDVVSLDLWVPAADRRAVAADAGVGDRVRCIDGDVRTADLGEFQYDAVVSVDAFEYFGTDVRLLPQLLRAVRPGGLVAMSTPALRADPYTADVPTHVRDVVGWEAAAWHAPEWWARHWELSGLVDDVSARWQEGGRDDWLAWERARCAFAGDQADGPVPSMLEADTDEQIGFALVTARKR